MTEPVISCTGVNKAFGDTVAVEDVTFDVFPGEIVSILGPSGCGKTTVLRMIAGLEAPDAGEITIRGELASTPRRQTPPERRGVGMVVQEYALFPHMTVGQNIAFGLRGLSEGARSSRVTEVMSLVKLENLEARYPHELSGGQQQRIALARTMAPRPFAVLLDEPFSNIDAGMRMEVRREVEAILRADGAAAVLVTHDREEAFALADRVGIMNEGRLEQIDVPEAVYHLPVNRQVAGMTGACDFIPGTVTADGSADTEAGILTLATAGGIATGAGVEVVVRPDDFGIEMRDSGSSIVEAREFRGDETVLTVRLPSGATVRCRREPYCDTTPGARVDLVLRRPRPFMAFSV